MSKFDLNMYRLFNRDLVNFSDKELKNHYKKLGKRDNRIFSVNGFKLLYPNFDVNSYRFFNNDLTEMDDLQLLLHYHNYGKNENRLVKKEDFYKKYPDFNLDFYRDFNVDLSLFSEMELLKHFENNGKNENRIKNEKDFINLYPYFSLKFYKNYYEDLIRFNNFELMKHYHFYGKDENRMPNEIFLKIQGNFDINFYKYFYSDLMNFSEDDVLDHFIVFGSKENRICTENKFYKIYPEFCLEKYKLYNPDLYFDNDIRYLSHFHFQGKNEPRTYKNINIHNLDYFNFKKYWDLYNNETINKIIEKNISEYNFSYEPEKYFRLNDVDINTRNILENYNLIFMLNTLINKQMNAYCFKSEISYPCERISFFNNVPIGNGIYWPFVMYHFNVSGDEFIILFIWEYNSPVLIYYPKSNEVYNISYRWNNIIHFLYPDKYSSASIGIPLTQNISKLYEKKSTWQNVDCRNLKYTLGFMPNSGHYFWQEILGFMMAADNNLIRNIDEFVIGSFDYLDFSNILNNKYSKSTRFIGNYFENVGGIPVGLSKHFMSKNIIDVFRNFYFDYFGINDLVLGEGINITIIMRTESRIITNFIFFISSLIKFINYIYPNEKINFIFSGWFYYLTNNYECYSDQVARSNHIVEKQKQIVLEIKNNVPSNVNIIDIIGLDLKVLLKYFSKTNLFIDNASSASMFGSTIFDVKFLWSTGLKHYDGFISQAVALNAQDKVIPIEKKFLNGDDDYEITSDGIVVVSHLISREINRLIQNKL